MRYDFEMSKVTAVYLRVSTDRQSKGLEAQERALFTYLASHGIDRYKISRDESVSGAKASRPELDRMMSAVRTGTHDLVIVYPIIKLFAETGAKVTEVVDLK